MSKSKKSEGIIGVQALIEEEHSSEEMVRSETVGQYAWCVEGTAKKASVARVESVKDGVIGVDI